MAARVGGIISVQANGVILNAKGSFKINLGAPKRKAVMGSDNRLHGYTEEPQPGFIEGEITDDGTLDRTAITNLTDATITVQEATGKVSVLRNAFYAGEGDFQTEESNLTFRFEGEGEEIAGQ